MHKFITLLLLTALAVGCDKKAPAKGGTDEGREPQKSEAASAATATPTAVASDEVIESDPVKLTPEAVKRFDIRIEKARAHPLTSSFVAPGRVSLNLESMAHVGSLVSGRVVETKVRAGDSVKAGDVLLFIDSPELGEAQSAYLQKRTTLTVATSARELAKSGYERAKKLLDESQGIALTEVQKREAEYKAAEGTLLSAKAEVTAAENRLKLLGLDDAAVKALENTGLETRYPLRSPLAGKVIERSVTLGELVRPERESLLLVADMSILWVLLDVPEARLREVGLGSKARITLSPLGEKVIEGKVSYVSSRLDEGTRTAAVRVEVPADGSAILPGMFAQAEVFAPEATATVLAVPKSAVQTVDGSPSVFVPVKGVENAFVARSIKTGPQVGEMVPVLAGLKESEPYVVSGSFILKADLGKGAVQEE